MIKWGCSRVVSKIYWPVASSASLCCEPIFNYNRVSKWVTLWLFACWICLHAVLLSVCVCVCAYCLLYINKFQMSNWATEQSSHSFNVRAPQFSSETCSCCIQFVSSIKECMQTPLPANSTLWNSTVNERNYPNYLLNSIQGACCVSISTSVPLHAARVNPLKMESILVVSSLFLSSGWDTKPFSPNLNSPCSS